MGIAQAMLNDPEILILDEPTAGLDPNERIRFRNLLSGLSQDRLVLLSTHIVSDVEYIANEIMLMGDGHIVRSGTPEKIMSSVPDRVWSCTVPRSKAQDWAKEYKVANMKTTSGGVELRILCEERPCPDAKQEEITLEDIFLYYFGKRAVTKMVYYEMKKIFSKTSGRIAVICLIGLLIRRLWFCRFRSELYE